MPQESQEPKLGAGASWTDGKRYDVPMDFNLAVPMCEPPTADEERFPQLAKWQRKFHHFTKSWDVMCFNVLLLIVITVTFVLTSSHSLGWNYHLLQRCPGPEECQVGWQASQCSELDTQRVQKIGGL
jgi:hypothetical protein